MWNHQYIGHRCAQRAVGDATDQQALDQQPQAMTVVGGILERLGTDAQFKTWLDTAKTNEPEDENSRRSGVNMIRYGVSKTQMTK